MEGDKVFEVAKTKIAFISPFSEAGATTSRGVGLSIAFSEKMIILPRNDKYGTSSNKDIFYFPTETRGIIQFPKWFVRTMLKLRSGKPNTIVILKASLFSVIPALTHKMMTGTPVIFDCDEWDAATLRDNGASGWKVWLTEYLTNLSLKHANRIIYCNTLVKEEKIPKRYHGKLIYVTNGADTDEFKPSKTGHDGFNVMFVGMLHKISHIMPLVDTMEKLKDTDVYCTVVGDGPKRQELEQIIETRGLTSKFRFIGYKRDILPATMSTADVFIAPFENLEGIRYQNHIKLFQYMASGKPIIATNVGDIAKVLGNGEYGRIVRPDEMAGEILTCKLGCEKMVGQARDKVVRSYDWRVLSETLRKHIQIMHEELYVRESTGVLS